MCYGVYLLNEVSKEKAIEMQMAAREQWMGPLTYEEDKSWWVPWTP